jgi:hypothetical protein
MGHYIDTRTSQFFPNLIPPYIAKGELVTGTEMLSEARRKYLNSSIGYTRDRIPVPAGEDGSVLQADSNTNTGLRWVPHEPIAKSVKHELGTVIQFLKPMIPERIIKEAERLESLPKLFVRFNGMTYTIPLDTSKTVQGVIDYLDEMYLVSLVNGCASIALHYSEQQLVPERTLADYNIQNESTLCIRCTLPAQQGGINTRKKNCGCHRGTKLHKSKKSYKKSYKK